MPDAADAAAACSSSSSTRLARLSDVRLPHCKEWRGASLTRAPTQEHCRGGTQSACAEHTDVNAWRQQAAGHTGWQLLALITWAARHVASIYHCLAWKRFDMTPCELLGLPLTSVPL